MRKARQAARAEFAPSLANAALDLAIEANRSIGPMLLERVPTPEPSGHIGLGDPREAASYASDDVGVWHQTEGAFSWLKRALPALAAIK